MEEQTVKLIEQLATKLGTTSEYLWLVLVKQAPVNGINNIITMIVVIIIGFILYKVHIYLLKDRDGESMYARDSGGAVLLFMFIFLIAYIVLVFIGILSIGDTVTSFVNPEYWALKKVLSTIK